MEAIVESRLGETNIEWSDDSSACVVMAGKGYPAKAETGAQILGLNSAGSNDAVILHAATLRNPQGDWLTAGGRVLGVTATGPTLEVALSRSYEAIGDIHWDGMQYRRDIGRAAARDAAEAS